MINHDEIGVFMSSFAENYIMDRLNARYDQMVQQNSYENVFRLKF